MPTAIESINLGFLLDGKWRNEGERIELLSPGPRQRVGVTYRAISSDAEAAIRAATRSFEITRRMGGYERQRVLRAISSGIEKDSEELARLVALEAGKPIKTARVEVDRAIFTFSVAAEEAVRVGGEYLPLDWQASTAGRWGIVRRFPVGPIAAITPFNFPLNLVAHKVAPAIAAGCTVVLKQAPQTPLTALLLAEAVKNAGWPAGALNVFPLSNVYASVLGCDDLSAGTKLLIGGHRQGSLMEATVLTNTRQEMRVNCEEVFAPVKTVEPYSDFGQALAEINASPYGLQAGLFTRDAVLIFRAYE